MDSALKLNEAIREITEALNSYNFSVAVWALYRFFWNEYCDWYVEASKAGVLRHGRSAKANTLAVIDFVLSHTIRFVPSVPAVHHGGTVARMVTRRTCRTIKATKPS